MFEPYYILGNEILRDVVDFGMRGGKMFLRQNSQIYSELVQSWEPLVRAGYLTAEPKEDGVEYRLTPKADSIFRELVEISTVASNARAAESEVE